MAYADKDMLDEAIDTIKRMVELTPDDPMVYTDLSRFYQRKGMIPEALSEIRPLSFCRLFPSRPRQATPACPHSLSGFPARFIPCPDG